MPRVYTEEQKARNKAYYERNKEKIAAARKVYYARNREKLNAASREYGRKNKERLAEVRKTYQEQNREKLCAVSREYGQKNKEKIRTREIARRKTKEGYAATVAGGSRGRARRAGLPHNITKEDVLAVIPEDGLCPVFGRKMTFGAPRTRDTASLDKIIPKKGYVVGNIAVVSLRANELKSDATADEILAVGNWLKGKENA